MKKKCLWVALATLFFSLPIAQADDPPTSKPATPPSKPVAPPDRDPFGDPDPPRKATPAQVDDNPFGGGKDTPASPTEKQPNSEPKPDIATKTVAFAPTKLISEEAMLQVLEQPAIGFEFFDTALSDVVKQLNDEYQGKLQFTLDERALENAGTDTQITSTMRNVKLKSALNLMLHKYGMAWKIENEHVIFTTIDQATAEHVRKTYGVVDLVAFTDEQGAYQDFEELVTILRETIEPESWKPLATVKEPKEAAANVPKPRGTITMSHSSGSIVVLQSREVHRQIDYLLAKLRDVKKEQGLQGPMRRDRTTVKKDKENAAIKAAGLISR